MSAEPEADERAPDERTPAEREIAPVGAPTPAAPAARDEPPGPRTRASLEDGFGIDSADGRFGVGVNILATMAYELSYAAASTDQGFRLVYMRPTLTAHAFGEKLRFAFQPAFDGPSPRIILGYADIDLHAAFAVRAGVYRPYYARAFIVGLEPLLLPDRGPVIDEFSSTNDLGVTVLGRPFRGKLEYYAAVMNGEGATSVRNVHPQPLVIGRVVVNPLGPVEYSQTPQLGNPRLPFRIALGVNGYTNEVRETAVMRDPMTGMEETTSLDRRDVGGGGELALYWRRLSAQAEAFYRWRTQSDGASAHAWGTYAQAGVFVVRDRLEPAFRVSVMDLGDAVGTRVPIQPGLDLYILGNIAKLQLAYRCDFWIATDRCEVHSGTLQAQFTL